MQKHKRYYLFVSIAVLLSLVLGNFSSYAKDGGNDGGKWRKELNEREYADEEIPEEDGDYKVKGDSAVRVKVFILKEKSKALASNSLVCGLSDPDSTAPVAANGWKLPSGSWTYRLNLSSAPASIGRQNFAAIASSSFAEWGEKSGMTFTRGADTAISRKSRNGKNIVAWGNVSGTALGATYIWYTSVSKKILEVDTILNKQKPWSWTPYSSSSLCAAPGSYDVQNILTHEIGHWLGLKDHYDLAHADSTMYGYGAKGEIKKDTLTAGDIAGIRSIYP